MFLILFFLLLFSASAQAGALPALPEPVANNAVALVKVDNKEHFISFMGLGAGKDHHAAHNQVWSLTIGDKHWQKRTPVPSSLPLKGRLASVAVGVGPYAYLFGGYTVAEDHSEISSPDNFRYDLASDSYQALAKMPVPTDDAVALTFQDKYIYLISGWHNDGNVNLVQLYDIEKNQWQQASPFLGEPVFGHAGGIVDEQLLVCDGVKVQVHQDKRRTFAPVAACYLGKINESDPTRIDWRQLPHPTGKGRYRMAAVGDNASGQVIFYGGSHNPYNYNGIGYDGRPSEPVGQIWRYQLDKQTWSVTNTTNATMDHRGLINSSLGLLVIGGMGKQQRVSNQLVNIKVGQ